MLDTFPNIVFRASAGTGKTHRLVELYTGLILGQSDLVEDALQSDAPPARTCAVPQLPPVEPERILLMTFTENAAAELRSRVSTRLNEVLSGAQNTGDADLETRTRRRLQQVQTAPICTIHAFCAQLLHDHALPAGLSPRFQILQGTDLDELSDQIAYETLVAALETDRHLRELCTVRKPSRVLENALEAARQLDRAAFPFVRLDQVQPAPDLPTPTGAQLAEIAQELRTAKARGKIPALLNALPLESLGELADDALADLSRQLREAQASKSSNPTVAAAQDWAARYWGATQGKPYLLAFLDLVLAIRCAFRTAKQMRALLDFQDLIIEAVALLERQPEIAFAPPDDHPRFDLVIVDEVQDNSRLQYRLLHRLWKPDRNRLVICGDLKQSIYGWRDADLRVMPDLATDVTAARKEHDAPACEVQLRTSWRSSPPLVDAINAVGAFVYDELLGAAEPDETPPVDVHYAAEALLPRPVGNTAVEEGPASSACLELLVPDWQAASPTANSRETGEACCVPWETLDKDALRQSVRNAMVADDLDLSLNARVADEALAVAARVRLLVHGDAVWKPDWVYRDETWTSAHTPDAVYRYRDVTILLRRTPYQAVYEEALRVYGVPYTTGGKGRGFFQRPEVRDVHHLLRVLLNPADRVSLLAFLRSPFAGLSDPAILALSETERSTTPAVPQSRSLLQTPPSRSLGVDDRDKLERARRLLDRGRALIGLVSTADLVRQMIRSHGFDAVQSGSDRGETRLANLRKLLDWINAQERTGLNTVSDVVRVLQGRIDEFTDEPEAPVFDPAEDAVRIMTVHAAKGLTQKVVFLPDLRSGRVSTGRSLFVVEAHGVELECDCPGEHGENAKVRTPGFPACARDARLQAEMENRNLFYVAITRARDLVVLSGESTGKCERKSRAWRRWIDQWLELYDDRAASGPPPIRVRSYSQVRDHARKTTTVTPRSPGAANRALLAAVVPGPLSPKREMSVRLPVTAFCHAFLTLGDQASEEQLRGTPIRVPFRLRANVALAEELPGAPRTEENAESAMSVFDDDAMNPGMLRTEFGTVGHAVFEDLDWRRPLEAQVPALILAHNVHEPLAGALEVRIRTALRERSELFTRIARASQRQVELPFAFAWRGRAARNVVFNGALDLVWRDSGGWHLLDYKFVETADAEALKTRYWLQLALYRRALTRLHMPPTDSRLLVLAPRTTTEIVLDHDLDDPRLDAAVNRVLAEIETSGHSGECRNR